MKTRSAALLLLATTLSACGATTISVGDVRVLVGERSSGGSDALLNGRLAVSGGCLGVEMTDTGSYVVVVWPHGTDVAEAEPLTVDVPGEGSLEVGDEVSLGGGFITVEDGGPAQVGGVEVPEECADREVFLAN